MRRSRRSVQRAVRHQEEHTHDDSCYTTEQVLICALPEHEHTLECLADYSADMETEDDWEKNSDNLSSAWYGNPYGDWDVMFVAFCQHYAGIPRDAIPQRAGLFALRTDLETINPNYLVDGCENAIPGDVVTYYNSNGYEYIGYLSIPSIGLALPVMKQWSYAGLKIAPGRYSGSLYTDDLVIAGHNYNRHFSPMCPDRQGRILKKH